MMNSTKPQPAQERPEPRLYLMTPPDADPDRLAAILAAVLETADIAAVLLRLPDSDERGLIKRIRSLAPAIQNHGTALILDNRADLVARSGADGAHLTGFNVFNEVRERLQPDRIAGCGGLASRHDAMLAAEAGADYVMFGEPDAHGRRPAFDAIEDRIAWWADLFETPCVGYAATSAQARRLAIAGADFIAAEAPPIDDDHACVTLVKELAAHLSLAESMR